MFSRHQNPRMNWVDRRFGRERNLGKAVDVWNGAIAAVHSAVDSFNGKDEYVKARVIPQTGHCVLVEVEHPQPDMPHMYHAEPKRSVTIAFGESQPAITVTIDAARAIPFQIEADETHCFLKFHDDEISADEFSELALKEAFFKPKPSSSRTLRTSHVPRTQWS